MAVHMVVVADQVMFNIIIGKVMEEMEENMAEVADVVYLQDLYQYHLI